MTNNKKKNILKWAQAVGICLVAGACLGMAILGICGIGKELERQPLLTVEHEKAQPIVRELYAWYYEEGTVEDEECQLWYFDAAQCEGQLWKVWINDNGTPHDVTDDVIVDYVGG